MDPLAYLKALRQWWWLPVLCVLVPATVAWATAPEPEEVEQRIDRDTVYEAAHTLVREDDIEMPISMQLLQFMIEGGEFPERLADRLEYDGAPLDLVEEFTITTDSELGAFQISTTQDDPEQAERWADVFAEEVQAFLRDVAAQQREQDLAEAHARRERIEARLDEVEEQIVARGGRDADHPEIPRLVARHEVLVQRFASVQDTVDRLELDEGVQSGLRTLRPAAAQARSREGGAPIQAPDNRTERTAAASAVGLLIGLALVLVIDRLDTRVRTRHAAADAFGLPVIAEIPKLRWPDSKHAAMITRTQPQSDAAEAFRMVRLALQLADRAASRASNGNGGHGDPVGTGERGTNPATRMAARQGQVPSPPNERGSGQVVVVTSPSGHDGKTTVVSNLAQTFAEMGQMVLCVDCDLRNPQLHTAFGLADGPGITDALADRSPRSNFDRLAMDTGLDGVWLLCAGTGSAQPWLAPRPDRDTLARLRDIADVVLIDSGPSLSVNDPSVLMPAADAVVVVARSGRINVEGAHRTRELLHRVGAPALGLVFNAVPAHNRSSPRHSSTSSGVAPGRSPRLRRFLNWWLRPAKSPDRAAPVAAQQASDNGQHTQHEEPQR